MRKMIVLLAGAACLVVAACNTVAGAGEDIEAVGENTSEAARDVQRNN